MEDALGLGRFRSTAALASAWDTLRRVSAANSWLWLVRPGAVQATAPLGLVLLDGLPRLLDALGAGAMDHG
ncbi:hypothetical protein ASD31_13505 [Rhizobium sp. Root482]|nr:hypothetical protein ASD31_13505 [Rhizobium sp. Root482]